MKTVWWLAFLPFISWLLTGLLRQYAIRKNILDIPNNRSSHTSPTPRGGGLAIVLTFLSYLLLINTTGLLKPEIVISLFGAGALIAVVGYIDDHRHIRVHWRLIVHFVASIWALIWMGGLPPLVIFGITLDFGWLGHCVSVVYLVWLLNLYNFMDGIDGIAGIEAATTCFGGIVLYTQLPTVGQEWMLPALLFAAVIGFLVWNFPKAKIFMGDAGSGFIGIVLGIFSIQAAWVAPELFWGWAILLGGFIVDATITLVRRLLRGERVYEAHRSHAYQYMARKLKTHITVSIAMGMINLLWLMPVAVLVVKGYIDGLLGVMIAYLPLAIAAIRFKAGAQELQET